jgi:hypothetical protein
MLAFWKIAAFVSADLSPPHDVRHKLVRVSAD